MFLAWFGEGEAESTEELQARCVAEWGWVLVADGGAAGVCRGEAERDQRAEGAAKMEQNPAARGTYVVELDDLKTIAPFVIDVAHLHSFEDIEARSLTLFAWHTGTVWRANDLGSILPDAGGLSPN